MDVVEPRDEIKVAVQITTIKPIFRQFNVWNQRVWLGARRRNNSIEHLTKKSRPLLGNLVTPFVRRHQQGQMRDKIIELLDTKRTEIGR